MDVSELSVNASVQVTQMRRASPKASDATKRTVLGRESDAMIRCLVPCGAVSSDPECAPPAWEIITTGEFTGREEVRCVLDGRATLERLSGEGARRPRR